MRRIVAVALSLVTAGALAAPAGAQDTFEGVIELEMTAGGQTMPVIQTIKGTRMRQEMQGPMGSMINILDTETLDMTMLMPGQRMYMEMNLNEMMAGLAQQQSMPDPEPSDFRPTGRTETIAGHECEYHDYAQNDLTLEICVAKGLGFVPFSTPSARPGAGAVADMEKFRAHFSDGFLPLAINGTSGGQPFSLRATRVAPGPVADSAFEIPEGYTRMSGPGE